MRAAFSAGLSLGSVVALRTRRFCSSNCCKPDFSVSFAICFGFGHNQSSGGFYLLSEEFVLSTSWSGSLNCPGLKPNNIIIFRDMFFLSGWPSGNLALASYSLLISASTSGVKFFPFIYVVFVLVNICNIRTYLMAQKAFGKHHRTDNFFMYVPKLS